MKVKLELDRIMEEISMDNGHIRSTPRGYDDVQGGFGFRYKNEGGVSPLDFTKSAWNGAKTQINYLLLRKDDERLCKNCKVFLSENLTTQHKLLKMDLEIKRQRKKIKWGSLTMVSAQEMEENMWDRSVSCIRKAAREVFGISRNRLGGHRGYKWWNGEAQGKNKRAKGDNKLYELAKAGEGRDHDLDQVQYIKQGRSYMELSSGPSTSQSFIQIHELVQNLHFKPL
ncbi:hypothetical protein H5410_055858 [Solanum commersonii]|uniref:Uncharacterized protein n=1 Tax=Solanum commersonii TaxID=4109 RepID=A0A9J5WKK8_SOLCO|nr:hypothetical protein H5410_055858 [Solanum commersonii]